MNTTNGKVPAVPRGKDSMNLQLNESIAPIFAAGFIVTALVFGGLSAGGVFSWGILRLLGEPVIELLASFLGGAAAASFIRHSKS